LFGSAFSKAKEKSSAALEQAKQSQAGATIASGFNKAVAAGSEQIAKVKETGAYKKSSAVASEQWERASVVGSVALEKVCYFFIPLLI
jgi:hypothetical protein